MCVMMLCESGRPDEETIEEAVHMHDDGIGVAWFEGKKVKWEKGIGVDDADSLIKRLAYPYVIHARAASIGSACPELCHPFPLTDQAETTLSGEATGVLFQNGTWNGWLGDLKAGIFGTKGGGIWEPGPWSDTRALAWLAHHYGEGILSLLCTENKMRLVTMVAGRKPNPIIYYGDWHRKEGYLQSSELGYYMGVSSTTCRDHGNCRWDTVDKRWMTDAEHWDRRRKYYKKDKDENPNWAAAIELYHGQAPGVTPPATGLGKGVPQVPMFWSQMDLLAIMIRQGGGVD